jgi:hypothetical protein
MRGQTKQQVRRRSITLKYTLNTSPPLLSGPPRPMPIIVSHPNSKTEPRRLRLCWGAPTPLPFANAQTRAPTTAFCTIRPSIGPLSTLSHHRFTISTQNRAPAARFAQGCTTPTSLRDRVNAAASPPSPPRTRICQDPNYPRTSPLAAPQQKPSPSGSICLG